MSASYGNEKFSHWKEHLLAGMLFACYNDHNTAM